MMNEISSFPEARFAEVDGIISRRPERSDQRPIADEAVASTR